MRRLLFVPLLALAACASDAPDAPVADDTAAVADTPAADGRLQIGEALPEGEALTPTRLASQAAALSGETVLVEGEVEKVCQMAGCWLTFMTEGNEPVRINVPRDAEDDYVFTFPSDAPGRTARVAGTLTVEEESVETLRHYAEDEGASAEAVAAITEPRRTLAIEALGAELAPATNA